MNIINKDKLILLINYKQYNRVCNFDGTNTRSYHTHAMQKANKNYDRFAQWVQLLLLSVKYRDEITEV